MKINEVVQYLKEYRKGKFINTNDCARLRSVEYSEQYQTIVFHGDEYVLLGVGLDDEFKIETPERGLRAKSGNIIDEACDMSKEDIEEVLHKFDKVNENNIYLNQKERNVIRTQMEGVLYKFERYVDEHLSKNELESAKADHNVVMVARSILSKLDIADCNDSLELSPYMGIIKR